MPLPIGGFDAVNLAFDTQEFDPLIQADAQKAFTDTSVEAEQDLLRHHLLQKPAVTATSSVADATRAPANAAIFRVPAAVSGGGKIIIIYQAGAQGAVGLVFRQSDDGGVTWSAETQVSSRQDVYPAGAMNPATGDLHLAYSQHGSPALSAAWSVWRRVLSFNGTTWTIGGEGTIEAGSATLGFSNVTIAADFDGHLVVGYNKRPSSGNWIFRTLVTNTVWDMATGTLSDEIIMGLASELRPLLLRGQDEVGWELLLVIEQAGTFRLYTSDDVSTGGVGTVTFTQKQTIFEDSTNQFDAAWNTALTGNGGNGALALVQVDGSRAIYRTYTPATDVLSAMTIIAGLGGPTGYTANVISVAVSVTGTFFLVAWIQDPAAGELSTARILRIARTDNLAVPGIFDLDIDDVADDWSFIKLPRSIDDVEMGIVLWCETLNTPFDVFVGKFDTDIFKTVADTGTRVETAVAGPLVTDTGAGVETSLVAGEAKAAADTGTGTDTISQFGPRINDTGVAIETFAGVLALAEAGVATEIIRILLTIAETVTALETLLAEDEKVAADTGAGADAVVVGPEVDDTGRAAELFSMIIQILESALGVESIKGGPNITDTGTGVESFPEPINLQVNDFGTIIEAFGAQGVRQRYDLLAVNGKAVVMYPGTAPAGALGWDLRNKNDVLSERVTRLFSFEQQDAANYKDIVFLARQVDNTRWDRLRRSSDGGRTYSLVGPPLMSCIAWGTDGVLWGLGNDETTPEGGFAGGNATGTFGGKIVCRQVFKSADKGVTWAKSYDDTIAAQFSRYPHYVNIAVDPANPARVLASGVRRGAITGSETQFASSSSGGGSWTVIIPSGVVPRAKFAGTGIGEGWGWDSFLLAVGSGRFLFAGNNGGISFGPDEIWSTDDLGVTWALKYSNDPVGNVTLAWKDATYRGGRIYACREDQVNQDTTQQLLTSTDNGDTWASITPPAAEVLGPGRFVSLAHDDALKVLYVGVRTAATGEPTSPVWRMDDPPGGSWVSIKDDIEVVTGDLDASNSRQALKVLSTITGIIATSVTDTGQGVESLVVTVIVVDAATGVETVAFSFNVFDTGQLAQVVSILKRTALSVRIFMHKGRAIIRVEGPTGPVVPGNPSG